MVPSGARRRRPTPRGRGEAFGPHEAPPCLVLSIAVFSARHRPRVRSNVSVLLASGSGFFTSEADTGNRLGSVGGRGRHNSSRGDPVDRGRPSLHPGGAAGDPGPASGSRVWPCSLGCYVFPAPLKTSKRIFFFVCFTGMSCKVQQLAALCGHMLPWPERFL